MKQLFIFIILNVSFLIFTACSENSVKPPPEEKLCEITDSTSHAVTWRVDTIGVWPSILYDVSAIDEKNVWAVGEIELNKEGTERYNAVKWNGSKYEYYKVFYLGGLPRLDVVLAFAEKDIWMFSQDRYSFWNGDSFITKNLIESEFKGSTQGAWGVSSNDFYLVTNRGFITHYDGTSFTLMETGTDISLFEIKGFVDPHTGKQHVWALGFENGISVVLKLEDGIWRNVWDMELLQNNFRFPHALYIDNSKTIVMDIWNGPEQKGRLYCFNQNDFTDYIMLAEHGTFSRGIGGTGINDIFIGGSRYRVEHFNGSTVFEYENLLGGGSQTKTIYHKNWIYICGDTGSQQAKLIHGFR
jgi:hypothetical protein